MRHRDWGTVAIAVAGFTSPLVAHLPAETAANAAAESEVKQRRWEGGATPCFQAKPDRGSLPPPTCGVTDA